MKLYSRSGDDGLTRLSGGTRVSKSAARVHAYGEVDELNALLGWCAVVTDAALSKRIAPIQRALFAIGAELATAPDQNPQAGSFVPLNDDQVTELERWIDEATGQVAPLRQFILPGGCEAGARMHLARVLCRRAERTVVALSEMEPVRNVVVQYLNRLSDLFFAWARLANHLAGKPETPWDSSES